MARKKKEATSIIEPTEAELKLYNQIIGDLTEEQLDEFATEYFEEVAAERVNMSFPKFVITKIIRPVKPGDTISFVDEHNDTQFLFCIIRKEIEGKIYLLFAMVNKEDETILTDQVYLFNVDGYDENGIEEIDLVPASEDAERILDLIEGDVDVTMVEKTIPEKE